ncbi:hypothetical protein INT43_004110 [Umbelopsis isabellina]|uniref:Uncharacterized protein n=1 Tax=Mortierella isabellina TaxID=91625 RepID=A0A8H7PDA3_MORIS|nr:hypothetical protein INT43_004110 [Umbelopsis isabellina]
MESDLKSKAESASVFWRYECHLFPSWLTRRDTLRRHLLATEKLKINAESEWVKKRWAVESAGKAYVQDKNTGEKLASWSTDTEACNTESDEGDGGIADTGLVQDGLEEQFRSEFSEAEFSEGNTAKEQNVEIPMEKGEVPLRYGVVDLTNRHAPSHLLLQPWYEWPQNDFYKHLSYRRHELCEREKRLILALGEDAGLMKKSY